MADRGRRQCEKRNFLHANLRCPEKWAGMEITMGNEEIQRQRSEWKRKGWSIPELRGRK